MKHKLANIKKEGIKHMKMKIINSCFHIIETLNPTVTWDVDSVRVQDVIWCRMPLDKEELMNIPPGHRTRPYVIVSVDEEKVMGFACSSSLSKRVSMEKQYEIHHQNYQLSKSSYVDTTRMWNLPYDCMETYYFTLSKEDFNKILECWKRPVSSHDNGIGVGTIISDQEKYYYIYRYQNQRYHVHPLVDRRVHAKHVYIPFALNRNVYYIDCSTTMKLPEHVNVYKQMQLSGKHIQEFNQKKKMLQKSHTNHEEFEHLKTDVHLQFPIGQSFQTEDGMNVFVYLFHIKNKAYGVFEDEKTVGYSLRRQNTDAMKKLIMRKNDEIEYILTHMKVNKRDALFIQHIQHVFHQQKASEIIA